MAAMPPVQIPRVELFVFVTVGCASCERAKKFIEKWERGLKGMGPLVRYVDLTEVDEEDWTRMQMPEGAPAYALVVDGHLLRTFSKRVLMDDDLAIWTKVEETR